eukprot:scaffold10267_cov270-Chaetoceros_neogracile.AAC.1
MMFNEIVSRIAEKGQDKRKLGRWSHIDIQGKNSLMTTIITCYCPVISSGPASCYSQQLVYMSHHPEELPPNTTCPRQLFGSDLRTLVKSKMDQGNQIILQGDFNAEFKEIRKWMAEMGLVEGICELHGYENAPKTYKRSKDSPLDCFFVSPIIQAKRGGYLSFRKLVGDHRGLYLDIPTVFLLGYNLPLCISPSARRLKMNDPRVVKKYCEKLRKLLDQDNLFHRMNQVHTNTTFPLTEELTREYETIDNIACRHMRTAEKQCRNIRTGNVAWSPSYAKSCTKLKYWKARLDHVKGLNRNAAYLIRLQRDLKIQYDSTLSIDDVLQQVIQAYAERRRCKKIAVSLSLEYRTRLALAQEEAGNIPAATNLRNMNNREEQRRMNANIRFMEGKTKAGGTTQVTVKKRDGTTAELTARETVEPALREEHIRKMHQTEGGSQLLESQFQMDIGKFGEGPEVSNILNGSYNFPANTTDATKDFLRECYQPENTFIRDPLSVVERFKELAHSWKIRKECTSTANAHIGHFKAAMHDEYLAWFFFQRAEIPEISGYSPNRHRQCFDLSIMKKAMSFDISKQRLLGILDTEFNHSNKSFQRKAMHAALDNDAIAPEQYSRPGRACIDHILNRRLTIDHHESNRKCLAMSMSDLQGCYDRIIHNAAALALLRIGVSKAKIHSMFDTIQRMIHTLRTAFGDSEITYGGEEHPNWENEPQGVIQGNASGPTIWSILSSMIFSILQKKGLSVEFCSSLSKRLFKLVGFSFVDDCDLIQSGTDPQEVAHKMQRLIQQWGDLMEVTGGALASDKSYWYLFIYTWKKGKWVATDAGADFDMFARVENTKMVKLAYVNCNQASEMLGIWMAPDGNKEKL